MFYNNERPTGHKQQLFDGETVENKGKLGLSGLKFPYGYRIINSSKVIAKCICAMTKKTKDMKKLFRF